MQEKKATIIKVSKLPWVTSHKSLKDAIRAISANLAVIHEKQVAKVRKKVGR
jgi:hypothetical protein